MVIKVQEFTCLRVPGTTTIYWNWMFFISLQAWQKALSHNKHIPFFRYWVLKSPCFFGYIIATHNQMNSEPTLSWVSSTINSKILFLFEVVLSGRCFWIQFQIETWLLFYNMWKWQCFSDISCWQSEKVEIETITNILWRCYIPFVYHKRNRISSSYRFIVKWTEPVIQKAITFQIIHRPYSTSLATFSIKR